jgi:membrane protein implicated in regulation of membrane protease activity
VLAGGDGDHDADADHDVDADADADHDHDHDAGDEGRSWTSAALETIGVGKIPLSMIWQTYALAFAATGFAVNLRYLGAESGPPSVTFLWSLPCAAVAGYVAVAIVAKILGPVLSSQGQEATSRAQLVGQMGVVISSKVDKEFGEVRIRDKTGHDIRVVCKLADGAKRVPTERQNVVVVDYEPERGGLFVEPLDDEDMSPGEPRRAG